LIFASLKQINIENINLVKELHFIVRTEQVGNAVSVPIAIGSANIGDIELFTKKNPAG
jgi:hypothetical protein